MKKNISLILVAFMLLFLIGCTNNQVCVIDLEQCEIGYELPVYPGCDFKFKTDDGEIVEVSNFRVILKEKNSVSIDETIDENFMKKRYVVAVLFDGKTDPKLAGKKVGFGQLTSATMSMYNGVSTNTTVENDGTFKFEGESKIDRYISECTFGYVAFY